MDPAVSGIAQGASSAIGGYLNYQSQKNTNAQNLAIAQAQMQFQERMSSTAHQREVTDLRAAGLNPILSATGGSGASAPSGSSATLQAPMVGDILKDSVNSGLTSANLQSDLDIKNATVAKTMADTLNSLETNKNIIEDTRGRQASNARSEGTLRDDLAIRNYERLSSSSRAQQHFWESQSANERYSQDQLATRRDRADTPRSVRQSEIDRELINVDNTIKRVLPAISGAASVIGRGRGATGARIIEAGTPAETRALERAGRSGLPVIKRGKGFNFKTGRMNK